MVAENTLLAPVHSNDLSEPALCARVRRHDSADCYHILTIDLRRRSVGYLGRWHVGEALQGCGTLTR